MTSGFPAESCDESNYPYPQLSDALENQEGYYGLDINTGCPGVDNHCGRLDAELKAFAKLQDPVRQITHAAALLYLSRLGRGSQAKAMAFADLAATGSTSFAKLKADQLQNEERLLALFPQFRADLRDLGLRWGILPGSPELDVADDVILSDLRTVIDRAYAVAWAIRGPVQHRVSTRQSLGWIAVSGEDDPPHRLVNVYSAPYAQFNLDQRSLPSFDLTIPHDSNYGGTVTRDHCFPLSQNIGDTSAAYKHSLE